MQCQTVLIWMESKTFQCLWMLRHQLSYKVKLRLMILRFLPSLRKKMPMQTTINRQEWIALKVNKNEKSDRNLKMDKRLIQLQILPWSPMQQIKQQFWAFNLMLFLTQSLLPNASERMFSSKSTNNTRMNLKKINQIFLNLKQGLFINFLRIINSGHNLSYLIIIQKSRMRNSI